MPTEHIVEQGDSVASLAKRFELTPEKIWDDPANQALRELRGDGNVLHPGDVIVIPDKEPRLEKRPTGELHVFEVLNTPAVFRLQIFDMHKPRANQDYTISVDTAPEPKAGKTDDKGVLQENVIPLSKTGTIIIGPDRQEIRVRFGHLNPLREISGVRQRLTNLGYDAGEPADMIDAPLIAALRAFQREHGLPAEGELNERTRGALGKVHDEPFAYPPPS